MGQDTTTVKVYKSDIKRIKAFGKMGDTMADATRKALDTAEGKK